MLNIMPSVILRVSGRVGKGELTQGRRSSNDGVRDRLR
jgi:hypothetical protein